MPDVKPTKVQDCGDGRGYASFKDDEGILRTVPVDANEKDGTPETRIFVEGSWKPAGDRFEGFAQDPVDPRFANRNLKLNCSKTVEAGTSAASSKTKPSGSGEKSGLRLRTKIITGILFTAGVGGSYATNKIALGPLDIASTNPGNLGLGLNAANAALDALGTINYVAVEPQLSSGQALALDGTMAAVSAGFLVYAGSTDRSGDSEFRTGFSLGADVLAARAHRHLGRKWGSALQLTAGAGLVAGGILLGNKNTAVSEDDPGAYEDPGMAGARDLDVSSPKFLNRGSTMIGIGAAHVLTGLIFGARAVFNNDSSSSHTPSVSISPKNGGGVVSWSGQF